MVRNKARTNTIFNIMPGEVGKAAQIDDRTRCYITPQKILWETNGEKAKVYNSSALLQKRSPQISLESQQPCVLCNNGEQASVLLDFGCELHGGIVIFAWKETAGCGVRVRIRFGESAMEAMSEIGGIHNSTNDHANRDMIVQIGNMSMTPVGETGFRFLRIDLLDSFQRLEIKTIQAVLIYKDLDYKGSFECNSNLLNRIWRTGAYTVHLNMQNYIWDGIKRDRLVWAGDLHPEMLAVRAVFGEDKSVTNSLDFVKEETPLPGWMNGFPAYSMWWAIVQHDWYMYTGNIEYLKEQHSYLRGLQRQMSCCIAENGKDITPETRFLDWSTKKNSDAVDAGIQALHIIATEKMKQMFIWLDDKEMVELCCRDITLLKNYNVEHKGMKQAAALMVLARMADAKVINQKVLSRNGAKGMTTFMGYYILAARAKAGDYAGALENIKEYWGGMLSLGATTFWEDFDVEWMKNALSIDAWKLEKEKVDVHGTYGGYCYRGYRHSLCHGWAAGVTPWLSEYVLGVHIIEPGCRKVKIFPHLGGLKYVRGTYPTPFGEIHLYHYKNKDGGVKSEITAPPEIIINE